MNGLNFPALGERFPIPIPGGGGGRQCPRRERSVPYRIARSKVKMRDCWYGMQWINRRDRKKLGFLPSFLLLPERGRGKEEDGEGFYMVSRAKLYFFLSGKVIHRCNISVDNRKRRRLSPGVPRGEEKFFEFPKKKKKGKKMGKENVFQEALFVSGDFLSFSARGTGGIIW